MYYDKYIEMINSSESYTGSNVQSIVQSLELEAGDHQIHYLVAGKGSPVVLVHGGASDSRDWINTIAFLSNSYRVYAPDLPGYGQSSRNLRGYYLSDFVEFISEFIKTLNLDSPVLVGHSLGGRACLGIAFQYPELARMLVLVDTAGFGKLTRCGLFLGTTAWAVRRILRRPQPFPRFLRDDSENRYWMCVEKLPSVQVPTLMIWNRHDPYHPLDGAIKARELIPESYLEVIPGLGHAPHMRKCNTFNKILLSFMEREKPLN